MAQPFTFAEVATLPGTGDHLYVFEVSDGSVKVGRTYAPRRRITQHLRELQQRGTRMLRLAIARPSGSPYWTELELVQRLARIGNVRRGTRERFEDVRFGVALNLLRQIEARHIVVL